MQGHSDLDHWQDRFDSTLSAISVLQNSPDFSDVTLRVDGKDFPVHSFLLRIRSKVFDVIFSKRWNSKEEKIDGNKIIELDAPVSLSGMKCLLSDIYQGWEELNDSNIYDVWVTSDYFGVESLRKRCLSYMSNELSLSNCLRILEAIVAVENEADENVEHCLKYIDSNAARIFSDLNNYKTCSSKILQMVLRRDSLDVPSEHILLQALANFAHINCDAMDVQTHRKFLQETGLIWVIRYNFLPPEDILTAPFLTSDEAVSILRASLGIEIESQKNNTQYETSPRRVSFPLIPVTRLPKMFDEEWEQSTENVGDGVRIKVDKSVFLKSITIFGPKRPGDIIEASVRLFRDRASGKTIAEIPKQEYTGKIIEMAFRDPPLLAMGCRYYIHLQILPVNSISVVMNMGKGGSDSTTVLIGDETLTVDWESGSNYSEFNCHGTTLEGGQISRILLKLP